MGSIEDLPLGELIDVNEASIFNSLVWFPQTLMVNKYLDMSQVAGLLKEYEKKTDSRL